MLGFTKSLIRISPEIARDGDANRLNLCGDLTVELSLKGFKSLDAVHKRCQHSVVFGHKSLEFRESSVGARRRSSAGGFGCSWHGGLARAQLRVALFFLAGLAIHFGHQRPCHAVDQAVKRVLDFGQIIKATHALGAGLELIEGLWPPQHHHGQYGHLVDADTDCFVENMFVFVDSTPRSRPDDAGQMLLAQRPQRHFDNTVVVTHDGFAILQLVTRQNQRIQRHGIRVGHRQLLFDEAAQHPRFFGVKRGGKGFSNFCHDSMVRRVTCENPLMTDRVTYTLTNGVADVRLNRPDKMNALDGGMFAGLVQVGEELRANNAVRSVVLSGNGRAFCAGLDFASFGAMAGGGGDGGDAIDTAINRRKPPEDSPAEVAAQHCVHIWQMIPVPVIAAVHGVALGGGIQIALGADIRIVAPDVKMSVLEIRWGLIPDMTGTQMLTRLVGLDVAKELTFTGRMVDGAEAVRIGLATRVSDTPLDDALAMAGDIAAKSPHAVRHAKALLNMAGFVSLREGMAAEQTAIRSLIGSPNQVEAVTAFFEKRTPNYADPG